MVKLSSSDKKLILVLVASGVITAVAIYALNRTFGITASAEAPEG